MPPPATKKRKTAATGAVATGTRRTTRSQKPLLSIEMIGKVGSFANYDNGDLMNICTAVGPKDARIVRHVCLWSNVEYLWRITNKLVAKGSSLAALKSEAKEELAAWMEINIHWRAICREEWTNDDSNCQARYEKDGDNMVKVNPKLIFNNPAVAIELGQVDVLKHLVEEIGIDVNAHRWSGYTSREAFHLLALAAEMRVVDKACFDYLIARQAVDVCAVVHKGRPPKLWQLFFVDEEAGEIFGAVISHQSFDPNKAFMNDEQTMLPLHFACARSIDLCEREETDHLLTKTKRLLDLGADPQLATESLPSPLDYVASRFSSYGEETEQGKMRKRLIAIMEEKVAAEE